MDRKKRRVRLTLLGDNVDCETCKSVSMQADESRVEAVNLPSTVGLPRESQIWKRLRERGARVNIQSLRKAPRSIPQLAVSPN